MAPHGGIPVAEARPVLVLTRYSVPATGAAEFLADAHRALDALGAQRGFRGGWVGRSADDPDLFTLTTRWDDVGSYRRALSAYEVKLVGVPLLSRALDEPTAYEVLVDHDGTASVTAPSSRAADADTVSLGHAAAPDVESGPW